MNDENNTVLPVLDDMEFQDDDRKGAPTGVAAPVLDDMDFQDTARRGAPTGVAAPVLDDMEDMSYGIRRGAPTGVSAPVLDDMSNYNSYEKKGAPTGVSAPVLDDADYNSYTDYTPEKFILTDEDIIAGLSPEQKTMFDNLPVEKQQMIIDMRRKQLGAEAPPPPAPSAPVLDEDNYTPPPPKTEPEILAEPITAPVLDDEPETPEYVPKYVDKDLERIKEEAKKKAVSSQLVSNQKDEKESLRMMMQLKEERKAEMAQKGSKITMLLAFVGLIAAVAFYLLYAGKLGLDYKDGMEGIANTVSESALYIAGAVGISSLLLLTGISFFKSLASFVFLVTGIIQLFPGLPMFPQHNGSTGLVGVLYVTALLCTVAVFVTLSASECVGLYFSRNKINSR